MPLDPLRGKPAPPEKLVNLASLTSDYYTLPPASPVSFGTSGHRGGASRGSFNETHVAAITAAVAEYRARQGHAGPIFLGWDTHALSEPAWRTALEVLAAAGAPTVISRGREYSPTPVVSFMILEHNRTSPSAPADGLIITPSHNPPDDGGIKYNPPHGGPADQDVTSWIEKRAADFVEDPGKVKRIPFARALKAACVSERDYLAPFVEALGTVVDLPKIKASGLRLAADPLGGSGVHFWGPIAERWGLNLTVVNTRVDPSFSFMTLDADGAIRMDCSSPYAMANLISGSRGYDLAFGNDPDFDRHGIVSGGALMNPNHYLAAAVSYLLSARPHWRADLKIGKTLVSSSVIDRVVAGAGRGLYETPVGFKWFVEGLLAGSLAFGGEESAGASFLRMDGTAWTTDKCGFCMALLAAEMTAATGRAPDELYKALAGKYGETDYERLDSPVSPEAKRRLAETRPEELVGREIAGRKVVSAIDRAPGNGASVGGLKAVLEDGSWFALRPSGTEPKMKLYAESFSGPDFKKAILEGAGPLVLGE
ncbi:MAG: phosphoglucomutase, alpha-D-glucose phosphate-specific [Deltaproteobacteria bacterium]|jgi:phosphoglucomutase|nr:phosphoglucomutase, alpha-D-glucose phosphate-specific [Deltaproteobacteria bacterium]